MHADRTNRTMLILLAVLLIAAGLVGGAASFGLLGSVTQHGPLSGNRVGAFIGRNGDWLWPVVAIIVLVIVLLALRWLLALLFSTDSAGDLTVANNSDVRGRSRLSPAALTSAVTGEIKSYRGVDTARARVTGTEDNPQLAVTVGVNDSADPAAIFQRIETEALAHARQAAGNPELPVRLDLTVSTKRTVRAV